MAGNPGRRPLNAAEPRPEGDLIDPPGWMDAKQKAAWADGLAAAPAGLLKRLDASIYTVWVTARVLHQEAVEKVGQYGLLTKTPKTGDWMQNPYLPIVNKQAAIMMKAAAEMGFTPSSRSRVSVNDGVTGSDEWAGF